MTLDDDIYILDDAGLFKSQFICNGNVMTRSILLCILCQICICAMHKVWLWDIWSYFKLDEHVFRNYKFMTSIILFFEAIPTPIRLIHDRKCL